MPYPGDSLLSDDSAGSRGDFKFECRIFSGLDSKMVDFSRTLLSAGAITAG